MKRRLLLLLSLSLNAGLAATLWYVWTWPQPVAPPTLPARTRRVADASVVATPAPLPPVTTQAAATLRWSDLASTDFFAYRDNLRAVGCPEKTVRDIIEAEINDWFLHRRQPLVDSVQVRFWDIVAQGGKDAFESIEEQFQALQRERRELIAAVLGREKPDPAAEEASRRENFAERYDWAPAELQPQLVDLDERLWQEERALQTEVAGRQDQKWTELDHARRKQLRAEHEAARRELLGDLAGEFELRNSGAAHWANDLAGFETTEAEWRAVARAKAELAAARQQLAPGMDPELMRRYGLLPSNVNAGEPAAADAAAQKGKQEALAKAQAAYDVQMQAALGPERLAEYERAKDDAYKQTRRVTQRLGLSDEVATQAREIQRAAEAAAEQLRANAGLDEAARQATLREIQAEAVRSLRGALGDRGLDPYQEYAGDWLKQLAPEK
jgi:hypothetical protein